MSNADQKARDLVEQWCVQDNGVIDGVLDKLIAQALRDAKTEAIDEMLRCCVRYASINSVVNVESMMKIAERLKDSWK